MNDNLCQHVWEPEKLSPPPGPPPPQSSISQYKSHSKGKLGKKTKCSKGQRDADSSTCRLRQQWTIVSLLFNSSLSMYSRGSLYSTPKG